MSKENAKYDQSVHQLHDSDRYEIGGESEYSRERSDPYEMVDYLLDKDFIGKGPRNYKKNDNQIFEEVCEALFRSPEVDARDIEVEVKEGCVYLNGLVESRFAKKLAEVEIDSISGVEDVQNRLKIRQKSH
jgi:osmotically-inducible protein OsmY